MEKLHYIVIDTATQEPQSVIAVPETELPHLSCNFDKDRFTLRGLTEAEFETYIVFGTLEEKDPSVYFEVSDETR